LTEKSVYLKVAENTGDEARSVEIVFINKDSQISEKITIEQAGAVKAGYADGVVTIAKAGTMKSLLGDDYLNITSLKVVGPINGDDVYYLRKMLGGYDFSGMDRGNLNTLDLSEASIVQGGDWYHKAGLGVGYQGDDTNYTSDNVVGQSMFRRCFNLQKIILPQNITSIESYAFEGCLLTSITIPEGVTSIGYDAFHECESLISIVIPASVTSIGYDAFYGCKSLVDVYIKDVAAWCNIDFGGYYGSNPLSYGGNLYFNNELVTELVVPEGVKEIKAGAFYRPKSITKVVIPNSVTSIGEKAFYECSNLVSVEIPNNVTSIGEETFRDCDALTSVVIGDGIKNVPEGTFYGCGSLATVVLGKGVEDIGESAFIGCKSLQEVDCYATTPPELKRKLTYGYENSNSSFFSNEVKNATLYVPARCGSAYKTSTWGQFFNKIKEKD